MKVDGRQSGLLIFDLSKLQKKEPAQEAKRADRVQGDKVSTMTSQKLSDVLSAIQNGNLLPDEVHSGLQSEKVTALLDDKAIDKVKIRPSDSILLKMADEVAAEMLRQPALASKLYSKLSADRTAEVL